LWSRWEPQARVRELAVLGGSAVVGFLAGAPGALVHFTAFRHGLADQFGHQATGHLGYDGRSTGWWFHLTRSLPGNWGWLVTGLAILGTVWVIARGTRPQRLVATFVVALYAVVGLSRVEFPHY